MELKEEKHEIILMDDIDYVRWLLPSAVEDLCTNEQTRMQCDHKARTVLATNALNIIPTTNITSYIARLSSITSSIKINFSEKTERATFASFWLTVHKIHQALVDNKENITIPLNYYYSVKLYLDPLDVIELIPSFVEGKTVVESLELMHEQLLDVLFDLEIQVFERKLIIPGFDICPEIPGSVTGTPKNWNKSTLKSVPGKYTANGYTLAAYHQKDIITQMSKLPKPNNFVFYDSKLNSGTTIPVKISGHTMDGDVYTPTLKHQMGRRIPRVKSTPIETALEILSPHGVYCIPIFNHSSDRSLRHFGTSRQEVVRADGKIITFTFNFVDINWETTKYMGLKRQYVSVTEYVRCLEPYASYCLTQYLRDHLTHCAQTGERLDWGSVMNMFWNNHLIRDGINHAIEKNLSFTMFTSKSCLDLACCDKTAMETRRVAYMLKAPTDFNRFLSYKGALTRFNIHLSYDSLIINNYGLFAPISLGYFPMKPIDRLKFYLEHNDSTGAEEAPWFGISRAILNYCATYLYFIQYGDRNSVYASIKEPFCVAKVESYARTHLARLLYTYGLAPYRHWYRFKPEQAMALCPTCYMNVTAGSARIEHCIAHNKKQFQNVMDRLGTIEASFNYWFQKMVGLNKPDFNVMRWMRIVDGPEGVLRHLIRSMFVLKASNPTMLGLGAAVGMLGVTSFADTCNEVKKVSEKVSEQVDNIAPVINEIRATNLVSKIDSIVTRVDKLIPNLEVPSDFAIFDYVDAMVTPPIKKLIMKIFPMMSESDFPKISLSRVVKNYVLAQHIENKLVKGLVLVDMLKQAGVFEIITKFYTGYTRYCEGNSTGTSFSSVTEWLSHFMSTPMQWASQFGTFIAGFVGLFVEKFDPRRLFKYIEKVAPTFRNFASIGAGVRAIEFLGKMIAKAYYLAKEYVCDTLGIKCQIPLYVHLREHMINWCAAVSTLTAPISRNTLLNTEAAWPLIDTIWNKGIELMSIAPGATINQFMLQQMKELTRLRAQIDFERGINTSVVVPFVIHFNGPPNIGKSQLLQEMSVFLSDLLGCKSKCYQHNEVLRFMDGYQGQQVLICDDVNLMKDPLLAEWLIKFVSPNMVFLPVAENEMRPCFSNVKVILLSSNTAYSVATGVATTDGIDRRSTYKFECTSKHYKHGKVDTSVPGFDWKTTHTFKRIPSVATDSLAPEDQFPSDTEGNLESLKKFLAVEALKHFKKEKDRIEKCSPGWRKGYQSEALRAALMKGIEAGNEPVDWALIRDHIKNIKFETTEELLSSLGTVNREEGVSQSELLMINRIVENSMRSSYCDMYVEQSDITRALNCYPMWENSEIVFRRNIDSLPEVDLTSVGRPVYDKQYVSGELKLDYFFLWHLSFRNNEFYIDKYYDRDSFPKVFNLSLQPPLLPWTHDCLEIFTSDPSFMRSWQAFFSLKKKERYRVYMSFRVAVATAAVLEQQKLNWDVKLKSLLRTILDHEVALRACCVFFAVSSLIGCAIMTVELMSSLLTYNQIKRETTSSDLTSNRPKPKPDKLGVVHAGPSTITSGNQQMGDIINKACKNIAVARLKNNKGEVIGTFNIVFVTECFALLPRHVALGHTIERSNYDADDWTIYIYNDHHSQFLRYTFSSKALYYFEGKDSVLIRVNGYRAQASLIKNWANNILDENDLGSDGCLIYNDLQKTNNLHGNFEGIARNDYVVVDGKQFHFKDSIKMDYAAPYGSSGGLLLIDRKKHPDKIIGVQSTLAYTKDHSYASYILRSQLEAAIKHICNLLEINYQLPTSDVYIEEVIDPSNRTLLGTTTSEFAVSIPMKTALKKTPWYGELVKPPDRVPVFSNTHPDDLYNYVNKTEITSVKPFDEQELSNAVDNYYLYIRNIINQNYHKNPVTVMSIHDAINGNYIGGKSLDLTTSPGIGSGNWIKHRDKPGQRSFITVTNDVYEATPTITSAISDVVSQLICGKIPPTTYASFPKDELRPLFKIARGIDGCPLEHKIIYKQLFGRLDGLLSAYNNGTLLLGLGIDLNSAHGVNLISRMSSNVAMWDFKNFDGTICWQMYHAVARLYNKMAGNDEFSKARIALSYATCHATIVAKDKVYQPNKGMRSGFGGTSSFNTHIHNLYIIMAVTRLLRSIIVNPNLNDILTRVDWIVLGDDCILWLRDQSLEWLINGQSISEIFTDWGLLVADPRGKTTLPPKFVNISECVFLKQTPYYDPYLGMPFWRSDWDCIQSSLSYYSGEIPTEGLDSAMHMLWMHGPDKYNEAVEKLNQHPYMTKKNLVYAISWHEKRAYFTAKLVGTHYHGSSVEFSVSCHSDSNERWE